MKPWFEFRKYGVLSIAVSLVEIIVIWGGPALVFAASNHDDSFIKTMMMGAYTLGFISSLVLALAGLAGDSRRSFSILALLCSVGNLALCSIPIAY
jgi:hypothetical protein